MKHLKLFKTQVEFDAATLELPNVNYIVENGAVNFHPYGETNLIIFTIDETEYQAEEGMTWTLWVTSKYNTLGFYIDNDEIRASNGDLLMQKNGFIKDIVYATHVINYSTYITWNEVFD